MKLRYHLNEYWPDLAWLADCRQGADIVEIFYGAGVETTDDWFCEAVWDDPFDDGHFDRTDLVFGSGCRIRDQYIEFVSSGSTVDRLQALTSGDRVRVSNSLVCLMSDSGAEFKSTDFDYFGWFGSVTAGLDGYNRTLATTEGDVSVVYYNNFRWDGQVLVESPKPTIVRDFGSYESYGGFLVHSFQRIAANMQADTRHRKYQWMGTLSSGYDTSTVSTIARSAGLKEAITFTTGRGGGDDSGEKTAQSLGLKSILLNRNGWRSLPFPEVPFLVGDSKGEEVYFSSAVDLLKNRVLLTGVAGSLVWDKEWEETSTKLARSDRSGLSLTEFRLSGAFLHLPAPYMGAHQADDIRRLSNLDEMAPWDISGDYNRPLCRRIVEEAGVPRSHFGVKKRAASVLFDQHHQAEGLSTGSYEDCVRVSQGGWRSAVMRGEIPLKQRFKIGKLARKVRRRLRSGQWKIRKVQNCARAWLGLAAAPPSGNGWFDRWLSRLVTRGSIHYYAFPWAFNKARERYRRPAN